MSVSYKVIGNCDRPEFERLLNQYARDGFILESWNKSSNGYYCGVMVKKS